MRRQRPLRRSSFRTIRPLISSSHVGLFLEMAMVSVLMPPRSAQMPPRKIQLHQGVLHPMGVSLGEISFCPSTQLSLPTHTVQLGSSAGKMQVTFTVDMIVLQTLLLQSWSMLTSSFERSLILKLPDTKISSYPYPTTKGGIRLSALVAMRVWPCWTQSEPRKRTAEQSDWE